MPAEGQPPHPLQDDFPSLRAFALKYTIAVTIPTSAALTNTFANMDLPSLCFVYPNP